MNFSTEVEINHESTHNMGEYQIVAEKLDIKNHHPTI